LCHVLEIYIWVAISSLGGIGVERGNYPLETR
jgi:hypothetical protein